MGKPYSSGILFLSFAVVFVPIFGVLTYFDSTSANFWEYVLILFLAIESSVIFCLDLIFIRTVLGKEAWLKWQAFWSWGNTTHWVLVVLNTVASTLLFGLLLLICFFQDNMSTRQCDKFGYYFMPAWGTFVGFIFFFSLFRQQPSLWRGAITYGLFALLLLILGLWSSP